MKKCKKCGIEKPLSEFYNEKRNKDGLTGSCKACTQKRNKMWLDQNRGRNAVAKRLYYENNLQKKKEYDKERYLKNREEILKREKQRRLNNPELKNEKKIYDKKYYSKQKKRISLRDRAKRKRDNSKQPACVYQITNKQNSRVYVGETLRGELRWKDHLQHLRGGYHVNSKLQEDFDKFGEEAFEWEILREFPKDKNALLLEEARTINKFLKEDKELYNLTLTIEQLKLLQENGE